MIAKHALQAIERNAARDMVHMMDANIGGHPSQYSRQIVVRTAKQGGFRVIPFVPAAPIGLLELMLNVEEPYADRGGQQQRDTSN